MNDSRDRRQSRKAQRPPAEKKPERPTELKVVIYDEVTDFISNLQPKIQQRVLTAINALSDPTNRTGSEKIEGRPVNDPMFRKNIGRRYRVFYKWIDDEVHAVEMEHRQGAYGKGKQKSRRQSKRR